MDLHVLSFFQVSHLSKCCTLEFMFTQSHTHSLTGGGSLYSEGRKTIFFWSCSYLKCFFDVLNLLTLYNACKKKS